MKLSKSRKRFTNSTVFAVIFYLLLDDRHVSSASMFHFQTASDSDVDDDFGVEALRSAVNNNKWNDDRLNWTDNASSSYCANVPCQNNNQCLGINCLGGCKTSRKSSSSRQRFCAPQPKTCGMKCKKNIDCRKGDCAFCYAGHCTNQEIGNCGESCSSDSSCRRSSGHLSCSHCVGGGCWPYKPYSPVRPLCPQSCRVDSDCTSPECPSCDTIQRKCSPKPPSPSPARNCADTSSKLKRDILNPAIRRVIICKGSTIDAGEVLLIARNNVELSCEDGQSSCTLSGGKQHGILNISGRSIIIRGITFIDGKDVNGGAIVLSGSASIEHCSFFSNKASSRGGAIYDNGSIKTISCRFGGNVAAQCVNIFSHGLCRNGLEDVEEQTVAL